MAALGDRPSANRPPTGASAVVEFLNLVLILIAALFVLRKPERERTAFRSRLTIAWHQAQITISSG